MSYRILFHPGALREFDKLAKPDQKRLAEHIDDLSREPRPQGVVKLTGVDAFRIRVGACRVIYTIKDDTLVVLIVKLGHRRDIYKEIEAIKQRLKGSPGKR
jgi:mRNA interferase RelE/StbE